MNPAQIERLRRQASGLDTPASKLIALSTHPLDWVRGLALRNPSVPQDQLRQWMQQGKHEAWFNPASLAVQLEQLLPSSAYLAIARQTFPPISPQDREMAVFHLRTYWSLPLLSGHVRRNAGKLAWKKMVIAAAREKVPELDAAEQVSWTYAQLSATSVELAYYPAVRHTWLNIVRAALGGNVNHAEQLGAKLPELDLSWFKLEEPDVAQL